MKDQLPGKLDAYEVVKRYIKSIDKGLLKVMSKMGISTYQSYCGAQIFDAIGLTDGLRRRRYFTGTATADRGRRPRRNRRRDRAPPPRRLRRLADLSTMLLDVGGDYAVRVRGEDHVWTVGHGLARCNTRCAATRRTAIGPSPSSVNEQAERLITMRGLFQHQDRRRKTAASRCRSTRSSRRSDIVKRFATGAMSFGSISREAHTTLAIAMNRIGGKSNTGEGGEEADRFKPLPNGDSMRSAIKQVASGRFGVTAEYLVNSDMMQIKMAQGAKPGEGGQLPGHKVDAIIANVRHSTPGVGLISPPPHRDIYSIEDLAQLIYDLKNVNPDGAMLGEAGLRSRRRHRCRGRRQGARRPCDHLRLRRRHRRVARSPRSSTRARPWEIGLAETQQTLVANKLRSRIARAGRWRPAHGSRRRDRRAAGRRRVRLRHRRR